MYQDMAAKLVAGGIPRSEIGLLTSAMSPEKRTELFDKVNSGEIRVVVGSTDLMGVGVNMQERLFAVHHLMPPRDFKPASMEQRNGRILRQGNLHYDMQVEAFVASAEKSTGKTFRKTKGGRQVPDLKAARAALTPHSRRTAPGCKPPMRPRPSFTFRFWNTAWRNPLIARCIR